MADDAGTQPLIGQLHSHGSNVAVVGGNVYGPVVFGGELRVPADHVIDFNAFATAASRDFVGRRDVFLTLDRFRDDHPCGYFEIVAEAGLGKTALAAEIAVRYAAISFFASVSRGLTKPSQFLTHLTGALIVRYALPYDRLPAGTGDNSVFLGRVLDEAAAKAGGPVWIVLDALDEAEASPDRANPLLLPTHLPSGVFVVVTHRPPSRLFTQPDTPRVGYALHANDRQQEGDIKEYVRKRVDVAEPIRAALAAARPAVAQDAFVDRLVAASRGNFMYVSYVLGDIEARSAASQALDLSRLPDGLQGYYEQFWSDIAAAKAEDWADWKTLYRPTLEHLAVAAEPVSADWIGAQIGRDADEVRDRVLERWTRLLGREGDRGNESWRLVHRSFADFLALKLDLGGVHRAIADHYVVERWDCWSDFDDYGLRHAAMHLDAAAKGEGDAAKRHALVTKLASLVLAPGYQQRCLARLHDPASIEAALQVAVRAVSRDAQGSPRDIAAVALGLVAFRKEQRQSEPIFESARAGDVAAAERRLDLFAGDVDPAWHDALLLTIAWLGASKGAQAARALRDRVHKRLAATATDPRLQRLIDRLAVTLDAAPLPALGLPQPPPPALAQAMLIRLGGASVDASLMGAELELMNRREPVADGKGYLAEQDGPGLVALAAADPALGDALLQRYVALHAAYGYREYRQGSLWALLGAVLQHPSQAWVQAWVSALGAAVLAPHRGAFHEGLALATLALQADAGAPGAAMALDRRRAEAIGQSETPDAMPRRGLVVDPVQDRGGDTWGTHRRRLAALAEALSRVTGRQHEARDALSRALALRWGFAGFNAPACLALAEAMEVAAFDDGSVAQALEAARASAHNIQDATFCLRTTARVTAMTERWWGASTGDVADAAARLADDASAAAFAAVHVVGDDYAQRNLLMTVRLPDKVLAMRTLADFAEAYQRPLDEFLRLNVALSPDQQLASGRRINVPDPGLPPWLAARFSARALADPRLSAEQKQSVIRRLATVAVADATALDAVLARLALASASRDQGMLAELAELARQHTAEPSPDSVIAAHLTSFVP